MTKEFIYKFKIINYIIEYATKKCLICEEEKKEIKEIIKDKNGTFIQFYCKQCNATTYKKIKLEVLDIHEI